MPENETKTQANPPIIGATKRQLGQADLLRQAWYGNLEGYVLWEDVDRVTRDSWLRVVMEAEEVMD